MTQSVDPLFMGAHVKTRSNESLISFMKWKYKSLEPCSETDANCPTPNSWALMWKTIRWIIVILYRMKIQEFGAVFRNWRKVSDPPFHGRSCKNKIKWVTVFIYEVKIQEFGAIFRNWRKLSNPPIHGRSCKNKIILVWNCVLQSLENTVEILICVDSFDIELWIILSVFFQNPNNVNYENLTYPREIQNIVCIISRKNKSILRISKCGRCV